jgi:hypothetical protein
VGEVCLLNVWLRVTGTEGRGAAGGNRESVKHWCKVCEAAQ